MKRPGHLIRSAEKPRIKPEEALEDFPLEYPFSVFSQKIKNLPADIDVVNHIAREYINAASLLHSYRLAFGWAGLATNSISYRLKNIKPEDFPEDFFVFNENDLPGKNQYFFNRLNRKLLKRIYLPSPDPELSLLLEEIKVFEGEWRLLREFEEKDRDDILEIID